MFRFTAQYRCNNCHEVLEPRTIKSETPWPPLAVEHDCGDMHGAAILSWYVPAPEKEKPARRIDGLAVVLILWLVIAIIVAVFK